MEMETITIRTEEYRHLVDQTARLDVLRAAYTMNKQDTLILERVAKAMFAEGEGVEP